MTGWSKHGSADGPGTDEDRGCTTGCEVATEGVIDVVAGEVVGCGCRAGAGGRTLGSRD